MPIIKPSSELRNNYNEISTLCHESNEPVYITKNGSGDLAVMSIETYEYLTDKYILYSELEKGMKSLKNGKKYSAKGNLVKTYSIVYSEEAKQDLINIKSYIKYNLKEPKIAEELISKIKNEVETLKSNPESFALIDEEYIRRLEMRKIIVKNHIIFYIINNNNVEIVRIMNSRRNWIKLLK